MQATFYILFSPSTARFYVGHTTQPILERLRKHNANHRGFTGKNPDWIIRYTELYHSKKLAYARERQVKAWKSKKLIAQLITRSEHPDS